MLILNLGCGLKTSDHPNVVNIDWSIYLRLKKLKIVRPIIRFIISEDRFEKFNSIPDNVLVHNLKSGIPFESDSVDVVYHSHLLEHLDRDIAEKFLLEIKRVLKPGGILRIVVPDLEKACKDYIEHISICEKNQTQIFNHDEYIAKIIEQMVRKEAYGTVSKKKVRRFIENLLLGDARKRGETHQWMYDRINLKSKLIQAGFIEVHNQTYSSSLIKNWDELKLDVDDFGNQYKIDSLYIEAVK